jgi:hypothetical protein
VDIKDSLISALLEFSNSKNTNQLIDNIFGLMHILGYDLGKDSSTIMGDEFLKLYLSDNPKERTPGLRKMN